MVTLRMISGPIFVVFDGIANALTQVFESISGFLELLLAALVGTLAAILAPVHRIMVPVSNDSNLGKEKNIFADGLRSCARIDAVFLMAALVFQFNLATAMLVAVMHFTMYTVWSLKVVSAWRGSATAWMQTSLVWLVIVSSAYAATVLIFARLDFSWYSSLVMVPGMMTLWMAQLVPLSNALSRLTKEAPVRG